MNEDAVAERVAKKLEGVVFAAGQRVKRRDCGWYGTVTDDALNFEAWVGVLWDGAKIPSCEACADVMPVRTRRAR